MLFSLLLPYYATIAIDKSEVVFSLFPILILAPRYATAIRHARHALPYALLLLFTPRLMLMMFSLRHAFADTLLAILITPLLIRCCCLMRVHAAFSSAMLYCRHVDACCLMAVSLSAMLRFDYFFHAFDATAAPMLTPAIPLAMSIASRCDITLSRLLLRLP